MYHAVTCWFSSTVEHPHRTRIDGGSIPFSQHQLSSPCRNAGAFFALVCKDWREFRIMRYRTLPHPCLENPENGRREPLPSKDDLSDTSRPVFGVITYIINDARSGEFDDFPVM